MQNIIVEKPYRFIPPSRSRFWPGLFGLFRVHAYLLRTKEGVVDYEIRHLERFKSSLAAGHAILITPNHPRTADPLAMGWLGVEGGCLFYFMTSWHLFQHSRVYSWVIQAMGGFSVNREGVDRQSINTAIELLAEGQRPMIIFPEGATSRTADRLQALLDGVAFVARAAAKRRAKRSPNAKVVVHPVAVKYLFRGDVRQAADGVLTELEHRLTWQPQREMTLLERILKVGSALLSLKEIEYFGQPQPGSFSERLARLMDRLLGPIEETWLGEVQQGPVVERIRTLRAKILPDMVAGKVSDEERGQRWKQLADIYLAQQLSTYPPGYLEDPTVDRVLEIVEKFEEDVTDTVHKHGQFKVILEVGEAIEVSPERGHCRPAMVGGAAVDPLMAQIRESLQGLISQLATESPLLE
jgi:1-acyl-sn-glycerol-3-phosphate acyltransferase